MRTVVISPHLDDAVLSAFAQLHPDTTVINVFTSAGQSAQAEWDHLTLASSPQERMDERIAEDAQALGALGIEPVNLDLYRAGADEQSVRDAIASQGIDLAGTNLFLPAGIGGHPGHLLVRDALLDSAADYVVLYADMPYAIQYGWPAFLGGTPGVCAPEARWHTALADLEVDVEGDMQLIVLDKDTAAHKIELARMYVTQFDTLDLGVGGRMSDVEYAARELLWVYR